ncbi:MAG: hypothetical protein EOL95_10440 [Bacteroidia bacterium]|nr:hypothetical protein [Bacteroidia bacterium]
MELYNALQIKSGVKVKRRSLGNLTQPVQFLLEKDKDDEWREWNMDWLEDIGIKQVEQKYKRLLKNYKLANGIIDRDDYIVDEDNEAVDMISILAEDDSSALELKFYPIIPNIINILTGEFAKRNDKILYRAVDDVSYNELLEQKRQMIEDVLMSRAVMQMQETIQSLGLSQDDPEQAQQMQQMMSPENLKSLPEIEQFFKKDYRSMVEQWATHQHNIDEERFYMHELENIAFKDMLITDSEFWHFKMNEDDYDIELWNPLLTFYYKSPETKYVSNGQLVGRIDSLTTSDVIDKYGYKMNEEQLSSLEEMYSIQNVKYLLPGLQNDGSFYDASKSHEWNTEGPSLGMRQFTSFREMFGSTSADPLDDLLENIEESKGIHPNTRHRVTTAYWKSQRLIGHLTKIDDSGFVVNMIIDENYKITDKPQYDTSVIKNKSKKNLIYGEHIDWIWINEVWGGVKIGPNKPRSSYSTDAENINPIYLDVKPLRFQFKGDFTLYGCKLPVEGAIFSERNSKSRSLVDKTKPYQIGYNLVNNQIADILIDEIGTVVLLDQNVLPQHSMEEDWGKNNYAKAFVAMKNFQMLPVDSSLSNTESPLSFQHYQTLNLEQTNRLLSRVQLANYFRQQCFESVGISQQRTGNITSQETATGVEQAINMSYAQTEMYFINHSEELMPKIHQMRTDLAQYYHSKNPSIKLQYMTSNEERVNFEMNGTSLLSRELNVYITTRINQRALLENIRNLAIQNNTAGASIYDLGNILKSDSLAEMDHVMKSIEEKTNAIRQQEYQHQQQLEQTRIEAEERQAMMEAEFEASENALDRETNIKIAEIRAAGMGAMVDLNDNQQNDYLDNLEYLDKREATKAKQDFENRKENNKLNLEQKKLTLKEKELQTKEKIANNQLKIARENKNKYDKK